MTRFTALLAVTLFVTVCAAAQSLKSDEPYPLKDGINRATSDSLVGTHYWYFYAVPGSSTVKVRLKKPTTLYGAEMKTVLTVTLTDAKRTWRSVKSLNATPSGSEISFNADKVAKRQMIVVAVAPPNQNLLRMGGDYEIEVTGNAEFNGETVSEEPIVRTYESKMNDYGATRFLADGSIIASDGTRGTWKAFDPENRIYTITIAKFRFSAQYRAGYGLVRPDDPNLIVFQELRR
jgi:hypothetical protein